MHHIFALLVLVFFNNNATEKEHEAGSMKIFAQIQQLEFESDAHDFLTYVNTPFDPTKPDSLFDHYTYRNYPWDKNDFNVVKDYLLQREETVERILKGDSSWVDLEVREYQRVPKIMNPILEGKLRTLTIDDRLTIHYPVQLLSLFQETAYHRDIACPPMRPLMRTNGWWQGNLKFAKTALKVITKLSLY